MAIVAVNTPRRPQEIVMPRFHTITRTAVTAVAIGALAAPAAIASPDGPASPEASAAARQSQQVQDLRHLEAGNSIRSVDTVNGKRIQDLRHLEAGNSIRSVDTVNGKPPVYRSYDYEARAPQQAQPAGADDGTPWATIAIVLGAMCLVVGGAAAAVGRTRPRARRARVAA
jgi:hypothetical protein